MLRHLSISNIILIESAEVPFGAGFNVISGETGAGKSAIMGALALIAGGRSDIGLIRKDADKGIVEAAFDIPTQSQLLDEAGIEWSSNDRLVIRREITLSGRSRAFVNDQLVSLSFLKTLGNHLFEMVGQHANQELLQLDRHRSILDTFGHLDAEVSTYSKVWEKVNSLRSERQQLTLQEAQRLRDIEICQIQREELMEAHVKEEEEESLFAEYTRLSHADELLQGMEMLVQTIAGEDSSALTLLSRERSPFQRLVKLDSGLKEAEESFSRALLELQEVGSILRQQLARIEQQPQRLTWVNERLTLINRLKKKYGPSIQDIHRYQKQLEIKLAQLEGLDERLEQLQTDLEQSEKQANSLTEQLSAKRRIAAQELEKALIDQLKALNMPKVRFEIILEPHKRTATGDDLVEFFFAPNVGEKLLPVRECASGGELSRLMLALKAVLAGKECVGTLVFDEIDANIGGETAAIVGHKLAEIGESLQLICISHFPQVARYAKHHLQISKEERFGRTYTDIKVLEGADREDELQRMLGGKLAITLRV